MLVLILMGLQLYALFHEVLSEGGGPEVDAAKFGGCVVPTSDSGYIFAGVADPNVLAGQKVVIYRQRAHHISWCTLFDIGLSDERVRWIVDLADGYYMLGGTAKPQLVRSRGFIVKIRGSDGNIAWIKQPSHTSYSIDLVSAVLNPDGSLVVVGGIGRDLLVLKMDSSGNPLTGSKSFSDPDGSQQYAVSVVPADDGGYLILGNRVGVGTMLIKLDSDCQLSWAKLYTPEFYGRSLTKDPSGGIYYIAGDIFDVDSGGVVIKIDEKGNPEWGIRISKLGRPVGGESEKYLSDIIAHPNGGCFAVGNSSSPPSNTRMLIFRVDASGNLARASQFLSLYGNTYTGKIVQLPNQYVVIGTTPAPAPPPVDDYILTLEMDTNGRYPGCLNDFSPTVSDFPVTVNNAKLDSTPITISVANPSYQNPVAFPSFDPICKPLYEETEESPDDSPGFHAHLISGGLVFDSPYETHLKVFSADGQLVYSRELRRGETRVELLPGVYFWEAKPYKGKAVVR